MPNLIEVQRQSYDTFLQMHTPAPERELVGLEEVFRSVFPVRDFADRAALDFVKYELEEPKYDVEECHQRGMTYAAPLRVTLRLIVWDVDEETGSKSVRDIKEQDVYMGDMPLMTDNGTFVVNGTERVIVSQMHRSPGVFFDHDRGKTHSSGKFLYSARIIPYRGSWLDFEFDAKDLAHVRIDRRRKLPVTTLLLALGPRPGDDPQHLLQRDLLRPCRPGLAHRVPSRSAARPEADRRPGRRRHRPDPGRGRHQDDAAPAQEDRGAGHAGGLPLRRGAGRPLSEPRPDQRGDRPGPGRGGRRAHRRGDAQAGRGRDREIPILDIDHLTVGPYIRNTLALDRCQNREEALLDIYRVLRPGEPPTLDTAEALFYSLIFDSERYDLSPVGRVKMNMRLGLESEDTLRVLRTEDIVAVVRMLVEIKDGRGEIDDIDHLGNRRVRSVGELMENQFRVGLLRMERAVRERMSSVEIDAAMPHDLINAKPVAAAVREFFGSSQLSQFMDQTNPLSEITHKRRLSALGPGGLTRERAGFEVRDVHPTHYGRICPIETPEGPNIGLINSLATYARINKYGFIESPYRRVVDGKVTDEVVYLSAMEEGRYTIAQANSELNPDRSFAGELVSCRENGEFVLAKPDQITMIDVSPKQLVSVAAALIPFLENDDANRALMGSNMQRQAVPLLQAAAPFVGTGMEGVVARDSGAAIAAKRAGIVDQIDGSRIVVRVTDDTARADRVVDIYRLKKFQRSNQNTCINQRPLVKVGDKVRAGDIIADGPSTQLGDLALGRNALVAFMPWNGYNFEDSILISERIVRDDVFTSIHIDEFEVMARDTKLGPEAITRDIPNVSEEALRNLDEAGIVYIGAEVKAGDILVGKVTPKGETPMTPEEKLLRAIFGEKAADVRDTSLKVPPGVQGTVVEVRVFNRRGVEKDERAIAIERAEIERLAKDRDDEKAILERNIYSRLREVLDGQPATSGPRGLKVGVPVTAETLDGLQRRLLWEIGVDDADRMNEIQGLKRQLDDGYKLLKDRFENKVEKLQRGDELPPGVLKMVKVFVAVKRKLQPGDKMAGRHGNKGVISRIAPIEDMPHLEDGTHVDLVLNPLGRAVADERRPDPGDPSGLGLRQSRPPDRRVWSIKWQDGVGRKALEERLEQVYGSETGDGDPRLHRRRAARAGRQSAPGRADRDAGVRRRPRGRHRAHARGRRLRVLRSGHPDRRPDRRAVRPAGDRRLHLHAEARPSGRRQDPRPLGRSLQPGHPAAAGRQGAVRRPALRRDGVLGAPGLRRLLLAAGDADGEVRRRVGPHQDLRGDRARRRHVRGRHPRELQRPGQGTAGAGARCRAAAGDGRRVIRPTSRLRSSDGCPHPGLVARAGATGSAHPLRR